MIDSLEMTAADRSIIVDQCRQVANRASHHTRHRHHDQTAGVLAAALGDSPRTVC